MRGRRSCYQQNALPLREFRQFRAAQPRRPAERRTGSRERMSRNSQSDASWGRNSRAMAMALSVSSFQPAIPRHKRAAAPHRKCKRHRGSGEQDTFRRVFISKIDDSLCELKNLDIRGLSSFADAADRDSAIVNCGSPMDSSSVTSSSASRDASRSTSVKKSHSHLSVQADRQRPQITCGGPQVRGVHRTQFQRRHPTDARFRTTTRAARCASITGWLVLRQPVSDLLCPSPTAARRR